MLTHVWFLERHDDHLPIGIFTSLEKIDFFLQNETYGSVEETKVSDEKYKYVGWYEGQVNEPPDFVYDAYKVKLDGFLEFPRT